MSETTKILVIEKDDSERELILTRLRARHYQVFEANESSGALKIIDREILDLILLSTEMEAIEGRELIELIRLRSHLAAVPVMMLAEEDKLSDLLLSREKGFDDFLVKPFNPLVLQIRVQLNISKTKEHMEANALTHLPGNHMIEKIIREKIKNEEKFSVLYIDINNFKSFNDRNGFQKGDDVIRQTTRLLIGTSNSVSPSGKCFVGHIGGDDFIVVTSPELEEAFARKFMDDFDRIMPTYYSESDQKRGAVKLKNRRGKIETFPLMSCSVAACTNLYYNYTSLGEIARDAAELKSFLKMQPGSHYLRDRRSAPISELEEAVHILEPEGETKLKKKFKTKVDPLGKVLLNAGLINSDQLEQALKKHLETGQRLGQTLINMNVVSSQNVGRMLERKLNIPYFNLKEWNPTREILRIFTLDFIQSHRVVPIEVNGNTVKLAMCDPFDLKTLDSIERITDLKPMPCLALEDEFEQFLEKQAKENNTDEK